MNKQLLGATLILAMGPIVHPPKADAAEKQTICASTGVADAGYSLVIAADRKTAELSEGSIAGPRKISDLDCEALTTTEMPDAINNVLVCRDARAPQTGLMARLYEGGFAGLRSAKILQPSQNRTELLLSHHSRLRTYINSLLGTERIKNAIIGILPWIPPPASSNG